MRAHATEAIPPRGTGGPLALGAFGIVRSWEGWDV